MTHQTERGSALSGFGWFCVRFIVWASAVIMVTAVIANGVGYLHG